MRPASRIACCCVLFVTGCGRVGSGVMARDDAILDISNATAVKASSCGYSPTKTIAMAELNTLGELGRPRDRATQGLISSDSTFYNRADVESCIHAILAVPCSPRTNTYAGDVEFLTHMSLVVLSQCSFEEQWLWTHPNLDLEGRWW